jgi:hypothetical protein
MFTLSQLQKFRLMLFQTSSLAGRSGVVPQNSRHFVRIFCHYSQPKSANFISEQAHCVFSMTYIFSLFSLSPSASLDNVTSVSLMTLLDQKQQGKN